MARSSAEGTAARKAVHGGAVLAAALSRDGKRLITGGDDGVVAVTDDGAATRIAERPGNGSICGCRAGRRRRLSPVGKTTVRFADGRERMFDPFPGTLSERHHATAAR